MNLKQNLTVKTFVISLSYRRILEMIEVLVFIILGIVIMQSGIILGRRLERMKVKRGLIRWRVMSYDDYRDINFKPSDWSFYKKNIDHIYNKLVCDYPVEEETEF